MHNLSRKTMMAFIRNMLRIRCQKQKVTTKVNKDRSAPSGAHLLGNIQECVCGRWKHIEKKQQKCRLSNFSHFHKILSFYRITWNELIWIVWTVGLSCLSESHRNSWIKGTRRVPGRTAPSAQGSQSGLPERQVWRWRGSVATPFSPNDQSPNHGLRSCRTPG